MIKHIIAGLLFGIIHGMTVPAFADPIKNDEYFTPHAQWDACYSENAPIMFKNLKQFLTSTNMRNLLILITVLLLMSLTLSSDHLIRSD